MKEIYLVILITIFALSGIKAQEAELHFHNFSERDMLIKVMKKDNSGAHRYSMMRATANSKVVEYFPETGYYFLKTKATYPGKEPVYTKGDVFKVYVGSDGYSVLTITYDIQESYNSIDLTSGERITEEEWSKN